MQLTQVNSERGAPMGRAQRDINNAGAVKLHLERVRLDSGGYDEGGAYWGLRFPIERDVLCTPIGHPEGAPPIKRRVRVTPAIYRYYWTGNRTQAARPIIEGFLDAISREDAKAQIRKQYPQATFYR